MLDFGQVNIEQSFGRSDFRGDFPELYAVVD
jgi:hypothetical protein